MTLTDRTLPPLCLLDVDGVLNALSKKAPATWDDWQRGFAEAEGTSYPILFSPTVVSTIARWHDQGLYEVRWLTTWRHHANTSLRHLLGLPEFPVEGAREFEDAERPAPDRQLPDPSGSVSSHADDAGARAASQLTGRWWKFDAVLPVLAGNPGRPILWIDDDLVVLDHIRHWMAEHTTSLLIAPRSELGLTMKQLRQAEEFLVLHRGGAQAP